MLKERLPKLLHKIRQRLTRRRPGLQRIAPAFSEQAKLVADIESPVVFDVGAHVGRVTEIYLDLLPTAQIFAFEPGAEARRQLEEVASRHSNVSVFDVAISDRKGMSTYYQNTFSPTNSLSPVDGRATEHWDSQWLTPSSKITVPTVPLDEFCAERGLNRIDILKLDIQGSELAALRGARQLLAEKAVGIIYLELLLVPTYQDQADLTEICCLLKDCGYKFHAAFDPSVKHGCINQFDAIFTAHRDGLAEAVRSNGAGG